MIAVALAAGLLVSAAACSSSGSSSGKTDNSAANNNSANNSAANSASDSGKTYKVGVILSLTGPAAAIGTDFKTALNVFRKIDKNAASVNIDYIVCDDQTTPEGAATCARKLIQQDKVSLMYGPIVSGVFSGAQPVLAAGPPDITPSPYVDPDPKTPIFSASGSAVDLDQTTMQYAKDKGYQNVGVLAATDTTGQTAVADVKAANKSLGLHLSFESMGPNDVDVSSQLNRLKQDHVQYVYIAASGAAAGVALKGMKLVGLNVPTALIWSNTTNAFLQASKSVLPSDTEFAMAPSWLPDKLGDPARAAQIKAFQAAFKQASGSPVSFVVQGTYDAFQLIVDALKNAGDDKQALLDYLQGLTDFQGLNWKLSYSSSNHRGSETGNYVMMRYDGSTDTWSLSGKS
jgi:branched-chain amino acid transport system substrate-binding protein